eukprot:gnl/Spiro4/13952_TR7467_c0_g1_i1.p1 gnl/Spiro4/13952_TR7467_c0_g1~~gnl/Spiro4/13952_TR7467_c0_g1_i1.p1  ORF type:complete len:331 (-),score=46.81 gnl/Spiro4/13952_TR7467_c0_g1_i1:43-969(-)
MLALACCGWAGRAQALRLVPAAGTCIHTFSSLPQSPALKPTRAILEPQPPSGLDWDPEGDISNDPEYREYLNQYRPPFFREPVNTYDVYDRPQTLLPSLGTLCSSLLSSTQPFVRSPDDYVSLRCGLTKFMETGPKLQQRLAARLVDEGRGWLDQEFDKLLKHNITQAPLVAQTSYPIYGQRHVDNGNIAGRPPPNSEFAKFDYPFKDDAAVAVVHCAVQYAHYTWRKSYAPLLVPHRIVENGITTRMETVRPVTFAMADMVENLSNNIVPDFFPITHLRKLLAAAVQTHVHLSRLARKGRVQFNFRF